MWRGTDIPLAIITREKCVNPNVGRGVESINQSLIDSFTIRDDLVSNHRRFYIHHTHHLLIRNDEMLVRSTYLSA